MSYTYNPDHIRVITRIAFSEKDTQLFKNFIGDARKVAESSWVKEGMKAGMTVHFGSLEKVEHHFKSWEQIQVVLHRLRPFILQSEEEFLPSVRERIKKYVFDKYDSEASKNLSNAIEYQTRGFEGSSQESGMILPGFGNTATRKFLIDYLNAEEFHRDKSLKDLLKKDVNISAEELQGVMSITVYDIVGAVFMLVSIMRHIALENLLEV